MSGSASASGVMTLRFVLAIDNGSQSSKVHVVDQFGHVHASAQHRLRACEVPAPGHVVHPDDDLWTSITAACRDALAQWGRSASEIEAVGLCTIRYCRALLRSDATLAEPLLSWMDARVSRPHQAPEARDEVAFVTTSSGYITARLTGRFVDSAANYQGVWPIDQRTIGWSSSAVDYAATGMPRDKLFGLVQPGELLGRVTADAARATGVPAGTPVFATANDKGVEALGAGVDDQTVLLSLGTYIAAMTTGDQPVSASDDYWVNFACEPGRYLYESNGIRRGMWTVSWAAELVGGSPDAVAHLNSEAAAVPRGCGGLVAVMDWLAPSDAPWRRGALVGFDGTQGRGHVFRAVLEGIALTMADHVEAMERALGRADAALVVTGGGAKSDLMMQVLADALDRPTRRAGLDDAAGLGSAMCAMVGLGVHPDFDAARAAMVGVGREFQPDPVGVREYAAVRAHHRAWTAAVRAASDGLRAS